VSRKCVPSGFKQVALFSALLTGCAGAGPASDTPASDASTRAATASPAVATAAHAEAASAKASDAPGSEANAPSTPAPTDASLESVPDGAPPDATSPPLPIPAGTKILHVGDSFAGALGIPLGKLLEEAGVRSILKHKDSSYLTTWAWEPDLERELWRYNPDLVLVTLGANELGIADPSQREKTVRKIVETIGRRPCLWIAIPLWSEGHNGLLEVIEKSSSPCVFYDTNDELDTLHMPRIHDGIHPTTDARRVWAEAVFDYLSTHRQPRAGSPWWLVE
jgi:hypothetical protein